MEKNFNSLDDCKRHLDEFSATKEKNWGKDEIVNWPERWQRAVEQTVNTLFNQVVGENEKRACHSSFM